MVENKPFVHKLFLIGALLAFVAVVAAAVLLLPRQLFLEAVETTSPTLSTQTPTQMPTLPPATTAPTQPETEPTEPPTEPPIPLNGFGPEDFGYVEGSDYLTCLTRECVLGLDVSKYQQKVDWEQVKAAGFEFVMIRLGARGYGESGNMFADTMAEKHYKGAKAAGLKVGAYFFSQALNPDEAIAEAKYALKLTRNWELDLPLVYDWEYVNETARTANMTKGMLTLCAAAFCETVEAAEREAMIYYSPWFGLMDLKALDRYPLWVALYKEEMTFRYRFAMWQYTCTGTVPGIEGNADINLYFPDAGPF